MLIETLRGRYNRYGEHSYFGGGKMEHYKGKVNLLMSRAIKCKVQDLNLL